MIILLITLISIAAIGFMWGSFMALLIFCIAAIIGYFTTASVALSFVFLIAIGSAIYKFDIINRIKNREIV